MGTEVYAPDRGAGADGTRNARYAYLVARLRNRQMTMEEATELFTIMQGMLQTSEAARAAMVRSPPPPPAAASRAPPVPRPPSPAVPVPNSDDMFAIGLLAMGAGAGLLAALAKRNQSTSSSAKSTTNSRPGSNSSVQKG